MDFHTTKPFLGYYIVFQVRIILRKNSDHSDFGQLQPGTVTSKESCSVGYLEKLSAFLILVKYLKNCPLCDELSAAKVKYRCFTRSEKQQP